MKRLLGDIVLVIFGAMAGVIAHYYTNPHHTNPPPAAVIETAGAEMWRITPLPPGFEGCKAYAVKPHGWTNFYSVIRCGGEEQ